MVQKAAPDPFCTLYYNVRKVVEFRKFDDFG